MVFSSWRWYFYLGEGVFILGVVFLSWVVFERVSLVFVYYTIFSFILISPAIPYDLCKPRRELASEAKKSGHESTFISLNLLDYSFLQHTIPEISIQWTRIDVPKLLADQQTVLSRSESWHEASAHPFKFRTSRLAG